MKNDDPLERSALHADRTLSETQRQLSAMAEKLRTDNLGMTEKLYADSLRMAEKLNADGLRMAERIKSDKLRIAEEYQRYLDSSRRRRALLVWLLTAPAVLRAFINTVFGILTPAARATRLARPPSLWFDWVLQRLMSDRRYRQIVIPKKADMHQEYFEKLAKGDVWGARFAVVRGNYNAVPNWLRRGALLSAVALLRWVLQ